MNELVEKNLANLVQQLTHSGSRLLNEEKMRQLKKICKQSDVNVEFSYRLLYAQISKNHAEIRYSTFQIIDQLFQRSHHFRTLLLNDFDYFIENTLELTVDHQLPPPKITAKLLKQFAATSIKNWHEKFGSAYKLLDVAFNYLKNCRLVNFENIDEPIGITAQIQRERQEAEQIRNRDKLEKTATELNEIATEINSCIKQAENCLDLLIPKTQRITTSNVEVEPLEEDEDEDEEDDDDDLIDVPIEPRKTDDQEILQLLGLNRGGKFNLTIDVTDRTPTTSLFQIDLTDDNRAVIENLHDLYRQLNDVFLKRIQTMINILTKLQQTTSVMKRAIDLKNSIKNCLKMVENYRLAPKKAVEPTKKSSSTSSSIVEKNSPIEEKPAPTLTDEEIRFYFHGDSEGLKRVQQPNVDVQNAFIRPIDRDETNQVDHSILMRKRTFVNDLPPIKWKCRAPIGNGKLCERMDRFKCPFHGRIVARNELGEAEDENLRTKEKRTRDEAQEAEYLEDLRLATGIDLKIDGKKKKRTKKNRIESNLTEIEREDESKRAQLEKKIFNRSSLKRIGAALDADERRRNEEKFHHQFNYSLNS